MKKVENFTLRSVILHEKGHKIMQIMRACFLKAISFDPFHTKSLGFFFVKVTDDNRE
jgi:hypothetical protein